LDEPQERGLVVDAIDSVAEFTPFLFEQLIRQFLKVIVAEVL
jgi:hypothetical protein